MSNKPENRGASPMDESRQQKSAVKDGKIGSHHPGQEQHVAAGKQRGGESHEQHVKAGQQSDKHD